MYLILKKRFCLRGWKNIPYAVYDLLSSANPFEITSDETVVLSSGFCYEDNRELAAKLLQMGMLEECDENAQLLEKQKYYNYGNLYFSSVIFSITGKCNYNCRHCHVSAPDAKMGEMSFNQIEKHIQEFKDCGLKNIVLIGGEPLVHPDFLKTAEKIVNEGLFVSSIYTNGSLVNEKLLDFFEELGIKPNFQISYDGYGYHDIMRGVKGAEKQFFKTLKLLRSRDYNVLCYMSITKDNISSLSETIDILSENGIKKLMIYPPVDCGNWAKQSDSEKLGNEEILHIYTEVIPEYIKKGFPFDLLLYRTAYFDSKRKKYTLFQEFASHNEDQSKAIICRIFKHELNISPEGFITPCYALMGDENFVRNMPNINDIPLRDAITNSTFVDFITLTSCDVMDGNDKCRNCKYKRKCGGGCRTSAYLSNGDFKSYDPVMCSMLENKYDEILRNCIKESYRKYSVLGI